MSAQKGDRVVLKIGDGASPVESFLSLNGARLTEWELVQTLVDASHAGSGAWRALQAGAGTHSLRVGVEGVFEDSAVEESLRSIAFAATARTMQLTMGNGDVISGAFVVERYARQGRVGELEAYAVTLQSAGVISFSAG